MNTHWSTAALCALVTFTGAACGDTVKVNETEKGALGESCRARNDCEGDLVCRDNVCTNDGAAGGGSDAGSDAAVITQVRGGEGESCQSRADCEGELACIDNVCTPQTESDAGMTEVAATRGKRGEDCTATSDCEAGLVCIGRRCREADLDIEFVAKTCDVIACTDDADCCSGWSIEGGYTQEQCDALRTTCLAGHDPLGGVVPIECRSWANNCVCDSECVGNGVLCNTFMPCLTDNECSFSRPSCVNERCVACSDDADCGFGLPFCVANSCMECRSDADCDANESCVDGACESDCQRDEHCELFEACQAGECVHVGCESDRQCYFATADVRAQCGADGECITPCESDAECGAFQVCEQERCQFVGCESASECRAYFETNPAEGPRRSTDEVVCRAPTGD